MEAVIYSLFFSSKITVYGACSHETGKQSLLGRKTKTKLDCVKKQRHHFANKDTNGQGYGLSSNHAQLWELERKEGRAPKNWHFWTVVLEKTLESPLDSKEINPEYSLEGLMLKHQYFGHLMWTANSLEKTLILEKNECRGKEYQRMRRLDDITNAVNMNLDKLWEMLRDREGWHASVHGVVKNQTQLGNWTSTTTTLFKCVLCPGPCIFQMRNLKLDVT